MSRLAGCLKLFPAIVLSMLPVCLNATPVISIQPGDQTLVFADPNVGTGTTVYFTATATSASSVTFQWQLLGATSSTWINLSDANGEFRNATFNMLAVTPDSLAASGDQFRVVVSDAGGSVTSSPATLTIVTTPPTAVRANSDYDISTLAGAFYQYHVDGTGSAARFAFPSAAAIDASGNLYVADANTIRKVTPSGVVTTVAGNPSTSGYADGAGANALFDGLNGIALDTAGNIYVSEAINDTIRKITPGGVVATLAGSPGNFGYVDGIGGAALFEQPAGIAVDGTGNVYVADEFNSVIRKITPPGVVTTLAGSPTNLGTADGQGSAARFEEPAGLAIDAAGTLYVADAAGLIREISPGGAVTTLAGHAYASDSVDGTGSAAGFDFPQGIAVDQSGNIYVGDSNNDEIRKVTPGGMVTTLAGTAGTVGYADGAGGGALFNYPAGLAADASGGLYIADQDNALIRKMEISTSVVTTLAGIPDHGSADGTGSAAKFYSPTGIALDSQGNAYVADTNNQTIRKITPGQVVTTFAGEAGVAGSADGMGSTARFNGPAGVAIDQADNVYVADSNNDTIRKISPAGAVTTFAGAAGAQGRSDGSGANARFSGPRGLATDAGGNLYIADTNNGTIRKITQAGVVTTLNLNESGEASLSVPAWIAADGSGNLYIASWYGRSVVLKIDSTGLVSVFAGNPASPGYIDAAGEAAEFGIPAGLAVDASGNLDVCDPANYVIRQISPSGTVTTLAGVPESTGSAEGESSAAQFSYPQGLAVDGSGNLYVVDSNAVRKGTLLIPGAPIISVQPVSQTVNAGSSVILAADASADASLSYQWYFNGGAIGGATGATLLLSGVAVGASGSYQVAVTDSIGTTNSDAAILTVAANASPGISTQPVPQTGAPGSTIVFTVAASNSAQTGSLRTPASPSAMTAPAATYQWQFNGSDLADSGRISGSTGPQLLITGVGAADVGDYSCVVTNGGVADQSNAASLQVAVSSNPGIATSISTRAFVGTGDNILIGGFFVVGSTSRTVLVQGLGPALGQFGVTGFLAHPTLSIHQTQNGGDVTLYSNTGWGSSQVLLNAAASVFASPTLPPNSPDSELLLTLPPGGYSAEVSGADSGSGVALCAIYELP